ncbi:phosphate signaling complex protein PhoU [Methylomonas sp. AM2-LC]|uniref:phosphate signaling complex protein PhoU n=1 Tax=Methylomonas sp. AM2-LC TaxID=3153301 RepID=UPI0032675E31
MSNPVENINNTHTLQQFDGQLQHLNELKLQMAKLVVFQLDQSMQALHDGDLEMARKVVLRDQDVNQLEILTDAEVIAILARQCPVANDLRRVMATSKIASELEKIGEEIVIFAKVILKLFDPKSSDPNPDLLTDIVKIGTFVKLMLQNMLFLLENEDVHLAYSLLKYDNDCQLELQEGIKHQLGIVVQDARVISRALDIMEIMKALEGCGDFCRNIAEYMIFMIEGQNVRHSEYLPNPRASK